ncbi:D-Ala-D-Ala carboxypeptidase family metallohydrolase [uncultured Vibrio sp.]|uniref:D-Ala-D-Ala carboxypeptidase family metallohydrolase n=1 Tax=uncultured Vibrio sp. TaxID=114054 RepID=UPI00260DC345|nr:D-Ala-D-Ala carboxypeptidase family metallohydrolase [uncultured Vibrio sp.]
MYSSILITLALSTSHPYPEEFEKLYTEETEITYEDLVVDVHGYKVPTRAAFRGWALLNNAADQVKEIGQQLKEAGVTQSMPLHLVLLQGTDWAMSNAILFTLPNKNHVPNMINTLKYIQQYIEPEIGVVIPVSGERSQLYNQQAGGALQSKHLEFCALDLVPANGISRQDLHVKLKKIHAKFGQKHNVGLGLYSGVRFHIDTCGFRQW